MENNQKKVKVCLKGNILDCMVIIHEIMHYLNQPYEKRNTVSDFLTESISYGCELIFLEDCLKLNYGTDADLHYTIIEKTFYDLCYYIYYIYKVILIYKYEKDINEDLYKKHFDDDGYNRTLNYFEKYVSCHKLIVRDSWVIIGIPLAIYMLEEYKKDKSFFDKIIDFNNSINDKSLDECLKVLNINDFNDLYDKISVSLSSYADCLSNIYKKYGEEQKVI